MGALKKAVAPRQLMFDFAGSFTEEDKARLHTEMSWLFAKTRVPNTILITDEGLSALQRLGAAQ